MVDRHAGQERFHDRISFAPPRPAHDRIRKRLSAAPALGTGPRQLGRFKELTILVDEPIEVGKGLIEAGKLRQPQAAEKKKHPGWPSLGDLGVELGQGIFELLTPAHPQRIAGKERREDE